MKLGELGSGFPLFYDYFAALIFLMLICMLLSSFALYDNYTAGKEDEHDEEIRDHYILAGSIAAHGTSSEPSTIQSWIFAATSWLIVAVFVILQFRRKTVARQIDAETISPSDFTLFVKGLPMNLDENKFKDFISKHCLPNG